MGLREPVVARPHPSLSLASWLPAPGIVGL